MKIKNLLLVLLSVAFFACGNDVDMQPEIISPQGTTPPDPPSSFNIIIHFEPVGNDGKKAEVRFGTSQIQSQNLVIDTEFFSSTAPSNPFLPLLDPYGHFTILAGNQQSQTIIVDTAEFPMCESTAMVKLAVGSVTLGSEVLRIPAYHVVGMNVDGSTSLLMSGTGQCGGSGQPGVVTFKEYASGAPQISSLNQWGGYNSWGGYGQ